MIALDEEEASVKEKVHEAIYGKLDGKNIVKEIYIKNKIYNVVVKQGEFYRGFPPLFVLTKQFKKYKI